MSHPVLTTRAFILGTRTVGEANRIITVFTEQGGILRVFARSIRSERSRLRGCVLPYAFTSASIVLGRQNILKDIRVIDPLTAIWENETVYTSYVTFLNFINSLVPAVGQRDADLFSLAVNAVDAYASRPPDQAGTILLTAQVSLLLRLGYVRDASLSRDPFPDTLSDAVTSPERRADLASHLRRGMAWQ